MKPKAALALNSFLCVLALLESFNINIRERVFDYIRIVNYDIGYIFLGIYIIPILIIFMNIKDKTPPMRIFLGTIGLIMSIFISISKADKLGDFIIKYHPYIYILPLFIISISLKAFNKKLAIIGILITVLCTTLLIKYLGYPHHLCINFNSFYTILIILYILIIITQILYIRIKPKIC